ERNLWDWGVGSLRTARPLRRDGSLVGFVGILDHLASPLFHHGRRSSSSWRQGPVLTGESLFAPLAEQLQARAGHFLHRINNRGKDLVGDDLWGLLCQTVFQPTPPGNA